jgi:hypothetical protein
MPEKYLHVLGGFRGYDISGPQAGLKRLSYEIDFENVDEN